MRLKNILIIFFIVFVSLSFVSAIAIKDVSSNPSEVAPGEIVKVTIKIKNILDYDVENVYIKLDLSGDVPFAPYESSSEAYEEEIDEGDSETVLFNLIVLPETKSGIYKIPVEISYEYKRENDTIQEIKTSVISLIVNSVPELKIFLEDSVILIKGKENEISLKIINSGLSDTKFVYVSAGSVLGLEFLNEQEQYIGDIDSDDFDSVQYKIFVKEIAVSNMDIPITIKYKDATNKEYTETKTLSLKTYTLKEARKLGLIKKPNYIPYIVVGVLIIGYFVKKFVKKKLKKRKS